MSAHIQQQNKDLFIRIYFDIHHCPTKLQKTKTQVQLNQLIRIGFEEEKKFPPTEYIRIMNKYQHTHTHTHTGTKTTAQAGIYTCKNIQAECRNLAFTLSCPRFKASSPQLGSSVGLSAAYLPPRIICHVEV